MSKFWFQFQFLMNEIFSNHSLASWWTCLFISKHLPTTVEKNNFSFCFREKSYDEMNSSLKKNSKFFPKIFFWNFINFFQKRKFKISNFLKFSRIKGSSLVWVLPTTRLKCFYFSSSSSSSQMQTNSFYHMRGKKYF